MKTFLCQCGQELFFESSLCQKCGRYVGFDHHNSQILTAEDQKSSTWCNSVGGLDARNLRLCENAIVYGNCNWLVDSQNNLYCYSCSLNKTIPNLSYPRNLERWSKIEASKRRLLYTLLSLNLDVSVKTGNHESCMIFEFLEDQRTNPDMALEHVNTGHDNGLITINIAEADDDYIEKAKQKFDESYRTVLGHMRHESGHFFYDRLIMKSSWRDRFRQLFGDEQVNYQDAINNYYAGHRRKNWASFYISEYAQSHALEDWAESWAHYLHIIDTAETAHWFGLIRHNIELFSGKEFMADWQRLVVILNELNRSMGLKDAYPFVISNFVQEKLQFIHKVVKTSTELVQM